MTKLLKIEGIGTTVATKLHNAGIDSIESLLEVGSTPDGRAQLAAATRISSRRLLRFVHRADLARVKGIGEEYADLLEVAGIHNVGQLADADADALVIKIREINQYRKLVRRLPAKRLVLEWIGRAQRLKPLVVY